MEEIKGQAFVSPDLAWQVARNVHQGVRRINHDIARGYCESDRSENLCWVVASRWTCSSFNCYDQSVDSYEVQVIKYTGNLLKIFFFPLPIPCLGVNSHQWSCISSILNMGKACFQVSSFLCIHEVIKKLQVVTM